MAAGNETKRNGTAESPISVLEDETEVGQNEVTVKRRRLRRGTMWKPNNDICKKEVRVEYEEATLTSRDAKNGDSSLISRAMTEVKKHLEQAQVKVVDAEAGKKGDNEVLNETQLTKLDDNGVGKNEEIAKRKKIGRGATKKPTTEYNNDICKEKVIVKYVEGTPMSMDAKNGDSSLISRAMTEKETNLEQVRVEVEEVDAEKKEDERTLLIETQKNEETVEGKKTGHGGKMKPNTEYNNNGVEQQNEETVEGNKIGHGAKRKPSTEYNNMEPTGDANREGTSKRGRGPTRCLSLYRLPKGQKLSIILDDMGQPVGDNATKLSNFCGTLARDGNLVRLDVSSWKRIDDNIKQCLWQIVQDKFDIGTSMKNWVIQSIGMKWRNFKSGMKRKYFDAASSDAERYAACPDSVLEDQWRNLVQFWLSDEGKKRSETNKANRSSQVFTHTAGTKSFARLRAEEKARSSNHTPPCRAQLFIKTHTRRNDGQPINAVAADKIRQMKELLEQTSEDSEDSTGQQDVFTLVMGPEKHGRIRGLGMGPTLTSLRGSSSSRSGGPSSNDDQVKRMKAMEDEIERLKAREATMSAEMQNLKNMFQEFVQQRSQVQGDAPSPSGLPPKNTPL